LPGVSASPIDQLLRAVDELDLEATVALAAPDAEILVVDGRRGQGTGAVREVFSELFATLRSSEHRITAEWHEQDVWIAEVQATYELRDRTRIAELRRAFVLREGPDGFCELHVYGAHERPLGERRGGEGEMRLGGHRIPPL